MKFNSLLGYTDRQNTDESLTSQPRGPVRDGTNSAPTISGTPPASVVQGRTYSFAPTVGDADGDPLTFRLSSAPAWLSLNPDTGELTGRPGNDDVGTTTSIVIEVTDRIANPVELPPFDLEVINANDPPSGLAISGTPREDQTLTADTSALVDIDGLPPESTFSYQWRADGVDIAGATGRRYRLTQADVDKVITLILRYTDVRGGDNTATSPPTAPVANVNDPTTGFLRIIGDFVQGETLTADTSDIMDEDGLGSFTYQWFRSGGSNSGPIDGATERTYTLTQADVGAFLILSIRHIDLQGTTSNRITVFSTDFTEQPIANINDLPTGLAISGGLLVGQTLRADTSALVDIDGLPAETEFSYQWLADGANIANATGPEYLLTAAQIGAQISLNLQYQDAFGADESITSPARGPVRGAVDNAAPSSGGLAVMTDEDSPYTFAVADFSFTDTDGDSLQAVRIDSLPVPASLGELGLNGAALSAGQEIASGAIANLVFTPALNASGSVSFTYSVSDGVVFSTPPATVTVSVDAVNDAPSSSGLTLSIDEDTPHTFGEADFTFSDGDTGDNLQAVRIDSLPTPASLGELTLNGAALSAGQEIAVGDIGTLVFTPALNASGDVSFTYSVSDGDEFSATANAAITIAAVNDPPTISGIPQTSVAAGGTYNFTPGGGDVDGDTLEYAINTLPDWAEFSTATGALTNKTNRPDSDDIDNYEGLVISVTDGIITTPVALPAFAIEVIPPNNPPTTSDLVVTTAEDTPYTFREADFPFSDLDAGDSLQAVRITRLPASTSGSLALDGVAVVINQVIEVGDIGTLVFTPVANFTGFTSFAYRVSDGEDFSVAFRTNIFITPVNDPPTTSDLVVTTAEDTPYTFAVADFPFTDVDSGDSLQAVRIDSLPASADGSLALGTGTGTGATPVNMAQVIAVADIPTLVYTPVTNVNGPATFTFSVSDGIAFSAPPATATVTLTAVNDPPTISGLPDTTLVQGAAYSFTPRGSDVDGDPLEYAITNLPDWASFDDATGALTNKANRPNSTDVGTTTGIIISVTDGNITTPVALSAFAIEVTATAGTNMPPTADAGPNQRLSKGTEVTLNGTGSDDPDGDNANLIYLWERTAGPTEVTLSSTTAPQPTFTIPTLIPASGPDSYTFSLVVSDGQASSTADAVTIFIRPLFRDTIANQTYTAGTAITALTLPEALAGPDSLPSTNAYTLAPLPAGLSFNPTSRILSGTPTSAGTTDLTYTATNGDGDRDSLGFSIAVTTPPNNPPTTSGFMVTTAEDTPYTFGEADFPFSDTDSGDSLQAVRIDSLRASNISGSLTLNGTAVSAGQVIEVGEIETLVFTPVANFHGGVNFDYSVSDGEDFSSASLAVLVVTAVNDPPTTSAFTVTTNEDTPYTFGLADFSFTDVEGDSLQAVRIDSLPASADGSLALGTGATPVNMAQVIAVADIPTLVYTPVANANGAATFTFSVSDGTDFSTPPATATLTVDAVNDDPNGEVGISGIPQVGQTLTANTGGISDADGPATLSFTYQWFANDGTTNDEINGATSPTYLLTGDESGEMIRVEVSYMDANDIEGTVVSDPVGPVLAAGTVTVSIAGPSAAVTEGDPATFTVTLSGSPGSEVVVNYAALGDTATAGSDFTAPASDAALTFAANASGTDLSQEISVPTEDDGETENDETFTLTLSAPGGGFPSGVALDSSATSAQATIAASNVPPTANAGAGLLPDRERWDERLGCRDRRGHRHTDLYRPREPLGQCGAGVYANRHRPGGRL